MQILTFSSNPPNYLVVTIKSSLEVVRVLFIPAVRRQIPGGMLNQLDLGLDELLAKHLKVMQITRGVRQDALIHSMG